MTFDFDIFPFSKIIWLKIIENKWDFSKFETTCVKSSLNRIIFEYDSTIIEKGNSGIDKIRGESLDQRTISGIPNSTTMSKIIGNSMDFNFEIERTVRPKIEINLTR